jgi:Uma2 family endonuclease
MTADEFLVWAEKQPERYELVNGEVVLMAAERAGHVMAKGAMFRTLADAVESAKLPCDVMVDGMAVRTDETTIYEPDVLVRCGPPLPGDVPEVTDPIVVVEVLSAWSLGVDSGAKLFGYFSLQSVSHYLVVNPEARAVTHYYRDQAGEVVPRLVRDERLRLDPPGVEIDLERIFAIR